MVLGRYEVLGHHSRQTCVRPATSATALKAERRTKSASAHFPRTVAHVLSHDPGGHVASRALDRGHWCAAAQARSWPSMSASSAAGSTCPLSCSSESADSFSRSCVVTPLSVCADSDDACNSQTDLSKSTTYSVSNSTEHDHLSSPLRRSRLAGAGHSAVISHCGSTFFSTLTPACVTLVSFKFNHCSFVNPLSCSMPEFVMTVLSRFNVLSSQSPFRFVSPASVTLVPAKSRFFSCVSPFRYVRPESDTLVFAK
jgi:hypothetical protein